MIILVMQRLALSVSGTGSISIKSMVRVQLICPYMRSIHGSPDVSYLSCVARHD